MEDDVFKKLFPKISDDELEMARENLDAYIELAWEIYEDMKTGIDTVDLDPDEL